jgi:hypothetical protein
MIRHATETPPPLPTLNPEVPEGLAQIIGWMMARWPRERYQSPARAAAALQTFLLSATAPPPLLDASEPAPLALPPPVETGASWFEELEGAAEDEAGQLGKRHQARRWRPDRRDYLCLLLGAAGLLLAQAAGWLLARLLARTPTDSTGR